MGWDNVFMITGRHVDVRPLTAEDTEKEQRMPAGLQESYSEGDVGEPATPQHVEGSKWQ